MGAPAARPALLLFPRTHMKPTLLAITVLAVALAACGSSKQTPAPAAVTPTATQTPRAVATADLSGYSDGVQRYYDGIPAEPPEDPEEATEAEYNKPPDPAEAPVGRTITLTGTNIGV